MTTTTAPLTETESKPKTPPQGKGKQTASPSRPTPNQARPARKETRFSYEVFGQAIKIAEMVGEPKIFAVGLLIEKFGAEAVRGCAERAVKVYEEAKEQGVAAYLADKDSKVSSLLITSKGEPRTLGGVLFATMREHAESLGLDWEKLRLEWKKGSDSSRRKAALEQTEQSAKVTATTSNTSDVTLTTTSPKPKTIEVKATVASIPATTTTTVAASVKPTRSKIVITGTPVSSKPKLVKSGDVQLLELTFQSEMLEALPKGLPSLGSTQVKVWLTENQWGKVKAGVTPTTRLLVEGEPVAGVNASNMTAFVKVVCTRLVNMDADAEKVTKSATPTATEAVVTASAQTSPLTPSTAETGAHPKPKPTRTKITVVGTLAATVTSKDSNPKVITRNDGTQLVELVFNSEMNTSLPKGLPNLGGVRVVVWLTPKQWNKLNSPSPLTPETRLIVEGEIAAAVTKDLEPFLRLVCTRITTPELEKARIGATAGDNTKT